MSMKIKWAKECIIVKDTLWSRVHYEHIIAIESVLYSEVYD